MRFVAVAFLAWMSVGQAAAQIFTNNTVYMAVQCDIGHFAKEADPLGLDPALKADVDFSWTYETSTKVEASEGISDTIKRFFGGVTAKQARTWTQIDKNHIKGTFNLHEENRKACLQNRLNVKIGIRDCLWDSKDVLIDGQTADCEKSTTVASNLGEDGQLTLWEVVDLKAAHNYDVSATYTVKISAPSVEKKGANVATSSQRDSPVVSADGSLAIALTEVT